MGLRVSVAAGTGFEMLLHAAAVADPAWRGVFSDGTQAERDVVAARGRAYAREVSSFGRFGWINLLPLLACERPPWSIEQVQRIVTGHQPRDLHVALLGGRRRQLVLAVGDGVLTAAVDGDAAARAALRRAYRSDDNVLSATPWLLRSASSAVQDRAARIVMAWPAGVVAPEDDRRGLLQKQLRAQRARLQAAGADRLLREVTRGVSYAPPGVDRTVLVASAAVAPVLVVVDDLDRTVIVHPPRPVGRRGTRASHREQRMTQLARALGDETRLRLLVELRSGDRTAVDLAAALDAPRTSLLHHLALLRSAGFVTVSVTPGDSTVYHLSKRGFTELASAAHAFVT